MTNTNTNNQENNHNRNNNKNKNMTHHRPTSIQTSTNTTTNTTTMPGSPSMQPITKIVPIHSTNHRPIRRLLTSSSTISDDSSSLEYKKTNSIDNLDDFGLVISIGCNTANNNNKNDGGGGDSNEKDDDDNNNNKDRTYSTCCQPNDRRIQLQLCADENYDDIHPHVYAPKVMNNGSMHSLGGGGSGVAVFEGTHPQLGQLVMKHGGYKDLKELFALATIDEDLRRRGVLTNNMGAAIDMQRRTPEFSMLYISPFHIVEKSIDLKGTLQDITSYWKVPKSNNKNINLNNQNKKDESEPQNLTSTSTSTSSTKTTAKTTTPLKSSTMSDQPSTPFSLGSPRPRKYSSRVNLDQEHCINGGMSIRLYESTQTIAQHPNGQNGNDNNNDNPHNEDEIRLILDTESHYRSLALVLPKDSCEFNKSDGNNNKSVIVNLDPYTSLKSIVKDLMPIMQDRLFKFTLAQRKIGGRNPKRGNQWLYEGKLKGPVLQNLVTQFIQVVRELQALTLPEEVDVVNYIREEVFQFENSGIYQSCAELSPTADAFVGNCIVKNFHPMKGRSKLLREISKKFREDTLFLTDEERLPAKHLGGVLHAGALMSDTFHNAPMEPTVLQPQQHFWRNILARAVDSRDTMSSTALTRIWTCGMTDAGIHNLFVGESDLYFFDLGEPQLQSVPGFLTKFLFSFFHTLGMEEDSNHNWIRRFEPIGNKLALTQDTIELLPKAKDAFEECLDRLVLEVLDDDDDIRWLLLQYVTLQLMSDTAFCLQRWETKGGGRPRDHNHHKGIEQWVRRKR